MLRETKKAKIHTYFIAINVMIYFTGACGYENPNADYDMLHEMSSEENVANSEQPKIETIFDTLLIREYVEGEPVIGLKNNKSFVVLTNIDEVGALVHTNIEYPQEIFWEELRETDIQNADFSQKLAWEDFKRAYWEGNLTLPMVIHSSPKANDRIGCVHQDLSSSCLSSCLDMSEFNDVQNSLLSGLCAVACSFGGPVGCAACLAAWGGINTGRLIGCVKHCW